MIDHERDPDPTYGLGAGERGTGQSRTDADASLPSTGARQGVGPFDDTEPSFLTDDDVMALADIDANWESFKQRFDSWPPPDAGIAYPARTFPLASSVTAIDEPFGLPLISAPRRLAARPHIAPLSTRRPVRFWSWAAAAAVMSVGAYMGWQRHLQSAAPTEASAMEAVYTGGAARPVEQRLPDGTRFRLGRNSTLTVRGNWTHDRAMTLVGDAYFDVASDPRPFIVQTDQSVTRVLGTKFFVSTPRKHTRVVRIGVLSGRVAVASNKSPGQMSVLDSGYVGSVARSGKTTVVFDSNIAQNINWIDGGYVMRNTSAIDVLDYLANQFDFHVQAAPGSDLDLPRINGAFPADYSLYECLKALKMTVGLRYVWYGNKLVVARLPHHTLVHDKPVEWMPPDSVAAEPPDRLAPPADPTPELLRGGSGRGGLTLVQGGAE